MNSSLDTVKERATLGLVGIAQGASAGLQPFLRGETVILCRVRQCKEGLGVRRNPQTQFHFEVPYVLFALSLRLSVKLVMLSTARAPPPDYGAELLGELPLRLVARDPAARRTRQHALPPENPPPSALAAVPRGCVQSEHKRVAGHRAQIVAVVCLLLQLPPHLGGQKPARVFGHADHDALRQLCHQAAHVVSLRVRLHVPPQPRVRAPLQYRRQPRAWPCADRVALGRHGSSDPFLCRNGFRLPTEQLRTVTELPQFVQ